MQDYKAAVQSHQRALAICIKLFGEELESTADSYRELGVTQYQMHDYNTALQSYERALAICMKLFGEDHERTAHCYMHVKVTQELLCKDRKTNRKKPFASCPKESLLHLHFRACFKVCYSLISLVSIRRSFLLCKFWYLVFGVLS